jgi:hypothetical protein
MIRLLGHKREKVKEVKDKGLNGFKEIKEVDGKPLVLGVDEAETCGI